jgi:hypothetical protein
MEISPKVAAIIDNFFFAQRQPASGRNLAQQVRRRSCPVKPSYPGSGKSDAMGPSSNYKTETRPPLALNNFWTAKPGVLH